ncbi:hypothetical protein CRX57_20380 [Pseudomonas putida]|uniref:Uncharacterized protein n=1 Tax=Pseudomonas putida TaxID=303 RepID=A0A2C5VD09_PSEPU|nr:hypothetical protein CRX57_20380 [Pseudomonas putida]
MIRDSFGDEIYYYMIMRTKTRAPDYTDFIGAASLLAKASCQSPLGSAAFASRLAPTRFCVEPRKKARHPMRWRAFLV